MEKIVNEAVIFRLRTLFRDSERMGMMAVGAVMSITGLAMPFVELGIVGSVVVLGLVIAFGKQLPISGATMLVGMLALFHGHAPGTVHQAKVNCWR